MRDRACLAGLFDAMAQMPPEQVEAMFSQDTIQAFNEWKEQANE
ncbi:hypothetical protein [Bifidobacterium cuniculi]|uniref:Uncharacterized protein n=1 Tax=Bifidobacterium cuniculi TaxID=1688 RepID=A0A087B4Y3_9BIFI|nr:hypothetical protein [Bifidobacterium cuniculi]KFI66083.1 hypothetical protein BCUN_0585 [Bifidobacterium cuniculi]